MSLFGLPVLIVLVLVAVGTSVLSGATGMGGGAILLAFMALLVDATFVVPLHGAVQFFSNGFRTILFLKHTHWRLFCIFAIGVLPGAFIGAKVYSHFNDHLVSLLMGCFIMLITWMPKLKKERKDSLLIFLPVGIVSGVISIFFGATGPFIAPFFVRKDILKEELIATKAACQTLTHIIKIPLFWLMLEANIFEYWPILIFLCGSVVVGTFIGKKLVGKMTDKQFKKVIKWILTAISIKMILFSIYLMVQASNGSVQPIQ